MNPVNSSEGMEDTIDDHGRRRMTMARDVNDCTPLRAVSFCLRLPTPSGCDQDSPFSHFSLPTVLLSSFGFSHYSRLFLSCSTARHF